MENQTTIFDMLYPKYKITKPIRLIEFFGGYGSQALALKYLGVKFEHWKLVEWAIKSIKAYKDIHFTNDDKDYSKYFPKEYLIEMLYEFGISQNYNEPMTLEQIKRLSEEQLRKIYNNILGTNNLVNIQKVKGEDLQIIDTDKYDYILTYSFPCQDLSLAGKGKGMSDTSTRSGLLWEVERILSECEELPQILLMENVPQVHSEDNLEDFNKWKYRLEELGYKNYFQDLIATDYGIPQTRNRTFMISLLGDYSYTFPKSIPLKLKLKDILEDNVNEKYYLSDKQLENLECGSYNASKPSVKLEITDKGLCQTLDTMSGGNRQPLVRVGNKSLQETLEENEIKNTCYIDTYNKRIDEEKSGTITTGVSFRNNTFLAIKNATSKGYLEATEGDGVDISSRMEYHRGTVQKGKSQTLTTSGGNGVCVVINKIDIKQKVKVRKYEVNIEKLKIVLREHKKYTNKAISSKLNVPLTTVEHWFRNDDSFSIPDENVWYKLKEILEIKTNEFDESITNFIEKDNVFEKSNRCYLENGLAPTLTATSADEKIMNSDLRIRKLTPRECGRLMNVKDEDIDKILKNQSDSSAYHLFGDSICTNVLMAIFGELLDIEWEKYLWKVQ